MVNYNIKWMASRDEKEKAQAAALLRRRGQGGAAVDGAEF
jgi:hypothetical protein